MRVRTPSAHRAYDYCSWDEIRGALDRLGLDLPYANTPDALLRPASIGDLMVPNSIAIHPVEGCDGSADGEPLELAFRRYRRFAAGGAGLIWLEATAVVPEGRANPRQLWIHDATAESFARLQQAIVTAAAERFGEAHRPVTVVQLTHSGRHSKPRGFPEPIIAHRCPVLDPRHNLGPDYPLITDDELDALQEAYVSAARIAHEAGFDAVDIKATHAYLLNELLASHTRENSRYGGSFENRTRMLVEVVRRVRDEVPGIAVMARLNVYDAQPYPYGFGMATDGSMEPDLAEPVRLLRQLQQLGLCMVNIGYGNPYYNPHVERPYDTHEVGGYVPDEDPLANVATMVEIQRQLGRELPDLPMVATGLTWLREHGPNVAAGLLAEGSAAMAGFGRMAMAYPDFVADLIKKGEIEPTKTCIACSSCTQIMRDGGRAGCVVRDHEVYAPIFFEGQMHNQAVMRRLAETCRSCAAPTCQTGCPAGVDVPSFVRAIADGDERRAYEVLREANPLPEICAYVCPSEVQCEGQCVQQWIGGGAVPIKLLQRYVSALARKQGWTQLPVPLQTTGKRVAVIGAGGAGLGCAMQLLQDGHTVTIIDAGNGPGGTACEVIPGERLASDCGKSEIAAILDTVPADRLQWRRGVRMNADMTVDDLLAEGFDAVFVGIGLGEPVLLPGADRPANGVVDALGFLREMKSGSCAHVPRSVAVLGGGNTAVDAAVTAKRAGARDVYLVYRRSFAEMPAWPKERDEALAEGVHFLILTQPLDYVSDDQGRLTGLRVASTRLGEPDDGGRRKPELIPDSERILPVDMVIEAIGQRPPDDLAEWLCGVELDRLGLIVTDALTMQTGRDRVYAGGDIVNGGRTVVQAVAEGVRAARAITAALTP